MYSTFQSNYFAHWLSLAENDEQSLTQTLASAKVDLNPHQIKAALFALRSPLSKGVILADEVGLGKTIEACLVLAQRWAEQKRKLLLIVPATLRKQWSQELQDKFNLPSIILESSNFNATKQSGTDNPFDLVDWRGDGIVIASYEFAARKKREVAEILWDLVVFDEAHKLRNIYKKDGAKTAKALDKALKSSPKILMTATPMQNSVLELFGLVSIIDPYFFGNLDSFKTRYARKNIAKSELKSLSKRLSTLVNRSLRKQVQEIGSFNFTKRYSLTEDFTPNEQEQILYERVSNYLTRESVFAIQPEARHLVTLVVRKLLASSSYAIKNTFTNMIKRLENQGTLITSLSEDYESLSDWQVETDEDVTVSNNLTAKALQEEIKELQDIQKLAESITKNSKADALLRVLKRAFEMTERLGGQRKAIIFTESTRTQAWLATLLADNDYAKKIVLLNGSNEDADSKRIYRDWITNHQNSGEVSGSKAADMKAALVDKFRDEASIMISTEAGAEGINLQFCSLLINYDLPWNPQRVEQRIGRIHRYGQKHDVVVVNFINKGNHADKRVFELLSEKFRLFEGVFGASDEILGSIESGVDIERRILEIYQQCRTNKEIDAAFERLKQENSNVLDQQIQDTSRSVLEYFDTDVVQRLNMRKEKTTQLLNKYQQMMMRLAKAELPDAHFDKDRFQYQGKWYDLNWSTAEANGALFFRPHEGLGKKLIAKAQQRSLANHTTLTLNYDQLETHRSDVRKLIGSTGELWLSKYTIETSKQKQEHLLIAAITDVGEILSEETAERLLQIPGTNHKNVKAIRYESQLLKELDKQQNKHYIEAEKQNEQYYEEETEKLDNWKEDRRIALDMRIKQLDNEISDARRHARRLPTLKDKMDAKKALKKLEQERDKVMLNYHEEKKKIEAKEDELLEMTAEALAMKPPHSKTLFTAHWSVIGTT